MDISQQSYVAAVYSKIQMRTTTRVLKNGRVTLSKPLRESLGLEHGDVVEVEIRRIECEGRPRTANNTSIGKSLSDKGGTTE